MKITKRQLKKLIQEAQPATAPLVHIEAMGQLEKEYSDWTLGDLEDIAKTTAPTMTPENEKIQQRYQQLRGFTESRSRKNKLIITARRLRRIVKEELGKAAPFGSGMEQADLEPEEKELVGHT